MTDYTVVSGDTFASIAKLFFENEAAAEPLALFNKVKSASQAPKVGATVKIPDRVYGLKSRDATTVNLSLFLCKLDPKKFVVFYSPNTKQYCVIDATTDEALTPYLDEVQATNEMANKVINAWQEKDPAKLITTMKDLSKEVESFFKGLATSPTKAIEELLIVNKHPKWANGAKRFFIRPSVMNRPGEWKDAADASVQQTLSLIKKKTGEYGLDSSVLTALCNSAQSPWKWNYADVKAGAEAKGKELATSATAQFVRFIAGCGLEEKVDALEKKLQFGSSGNLAFNLSTGNVSGSWYMPAETGINLFEILKVPAPPSGVMPVCMLRCEIKATGYACTEGNLSHFVSLPGLSLEGGGAGPVASASGSSSASAAGTLMGSVGWSPEDAKPFASLAKVDLAAKLGAKTQMSFSFAQKKLTCSIPVKNIQGFSGSGSIDFEVSSEEGLRFIEHIFSCIVYQYISGFSGKLDGVASLVSSRFMPIIEKIEKKAATVTQKVIAFTSWFGDGKVVDSTASGTWYIPEEQGFDLVALVAGVPLLRPLVKSGAHCFVRIKIELSGYAFAKATKAESGLPNAQTITGAAGAGTQVKCSIEWRANASDAFKPLGVVQGNAAISGLAGMVLPVPVGIGYKDGTLNGILPVRSIPGLGIKTDANIFFTAYGDEAKSFVNNLFSSLNVDLSDFLNSEMIQGAKSMGSTIGNVATAIHPDAIQDAKNGANDIFKKL